MSVLNKLNEIFSTPANYADEYVKYQIYFFNTLSIIGIITLVIFTIYNFTIEATTLAVSEGLITLVLIINLIIFQKYKNIKSGSVALMLIMIALSIVLLFKGGIENTGIFWLYIYPILAFFLQGKYYGFIWVIVFIAINFTFAVLAQYEIIELSYTFIEIRQFLISLFVLSIMTFFYEKVASSMKKNLKHANEELQSKVQEELEKNRKKDLLLMEQSRHAQMGEMIAMIAHQWRQPLSSISATAISLQMKQELGKYDKVLFHEQLQNIEGYTQHLSKTIDDFRNFFKKEKEKAYTTLEDVLDDSIKIFKPIISNKNTNIYLKYNSNETIYTYPNELKQVILNLLKNAQEVLEDKNVKEPKIEISTYKDGKHLYFEILDNAGGIDENIIDKVFDPYFTTKGKLHGTGLGLYMSKQIVEEHCNGSMEVQNTTNGALFRCKFINEKLTQRNSDG